MVPISSAGGVAPIRLGMVLVNRRSLAWLCKEAYGWPVVETVAAWPGLGVVRGRTLVGLAAFMDTIGCWRLKLGAMPMRLGCVE
jgi:hypothetical protein